MRNQSEVLGEVAIAFPDDPRPEVKLWISNYKDKYGTVPDMFTTLAYDSTKIPLRAIEAANLKPRPVK
ncbi:MAG: hypothetical protein AB1523_15050 [Bacillota bacterium]